jgi:hypothetical protein
MDPLYINALVGCYFSMPLIGFENLERMVNKMLNIDLSVLQKT